MGETYINLNISKEVPVVEILKSKDVQQNQSLMNRSNHIKLSDSNLNNLNLENVTPAILPVTKNNSNELKINTTNHPKFPNDLKKDKIGEDPEDLFPERNTQIGVETKKNLSNHMNLLKETENEISLKITHLKSELEMLFSVNSNIQQMSRNVVKEAT